MIHDVIEEAIPTEPLPIKLYFPLAQNLFGLFCMTIPCILLIFLTLSSRYRSTNSVIFGVAISVILCSVYIWSSVITFKRLVKNVRYWGRREPVLLLTEEGISYLDIFQLSWADIQDIKLYDLFTGGRNNISVLQVLIIASKDPAINQSDSLEGKTYRKATENVRNKISQKFPDFPVNRVCVLDPRGLDMNAKKLAQTIKNLLSRSKK